MRTPHSALRIPHSRGVALVITLVLLSVITFMAITFLVISHGQHSSVTTETEQAIARLAADAARERAMVQVMAPILTWTNEYNYGLLCSTNYINVHGFTNGVSDPLNVNYDYDSSGAALSAFERNRNIANLLYDPRAPVFITNRLFANSNEFRFYLDLNRDGRYEPTGLLPVINTNGGYFDLAGNLLPAGPVPLTGVLSNFVNGDPEWIGVLQRPEFAHSPSNYFTARYAYIVVPASQTLDINYIHNDANQQDLGTNSANDGFVRNQGVGSWELNLGAFLADLNTNFWPSYVYNGWLGTQNGGVAFEDASRFLWYRYRGNWNNLASVSSLFGARGVNAFDRDLFDGYSAGPVMTGVWWPGPDADIPRTSRSWSGAENPNRFFTTQDLFDKSKIPPLGPASSFVDRLTDAGKQMDSYNRYTFYRLLQQLGTDSAPEPGGKMNLNYCNVDTNGYVVPDMATNFIPWGPVQFFTNAAIRLLADSGYAVGAPNSTSNVLVYGSNYVNGMWLAVTNLHIPIWPPPFTNYAPSVHRCLQLAANIYDSTTNHVDVTDEPYLPTVFRPIFRKEGTRVFVVGYRDAHDDQSFVQEVIRRWDLVRDLSDPNDFAAFKPDTDLVFNVPLVIGSKKGLPNFNELAVKTDLRITRKLQFHRPGDSTTLPVNEINQMFVVGVSNTLGVEAWNSYTNAFRRDLRIVVWPDVSILVTNLETGTWLNQPPLVSRVRVGPGQQPFGTNTTGGIGGRNPWYGYESWNEKASFQIPLATNIVFLTNAVYRRSLDAFVVPPSSQFGQFERQAGSTNFYVPRWYVKVRPRVRFAIVDPSGPRLLDYVNFASDVSTDLAPALGTCSDTYAPSGANGSMWCTNRMGGIASDSVPTYGIQNQLEASLGHVTADWSSSTAEFPAGMSRTDAIAFFKGQFTPGYPKSSNTFNAPFQPSRSLYFVSALQANDPLVHYNEGDLTDLVGSSKRVVTEFTSGVPDPTENLGKVNKRYQPWGWQGGSSTPTVGLFEMAVKDPVAYDPIKDTAFGSSDMWEFPTNRYPNVGWLGRVHRGTPWQTVYFKPDGYDLIKWRQWSGAGEIRTNFGQVPAAMVQLYNTYYDSSLTQPTNDWRLLDLFTTALDGNATRSQLSINQTNLAAWSAVLSGVTVLTNFDANNNPVRSAMVIQPARVYNAFDTNTWSPVVHLVKRIAEYRHTNNVRHVFTRLGDLLGLPEMTVASPFINRTVTPGMPDYAIDDATIERLPQQIMGLLKVDSVPRFVIYAYGQSLKPADRKPFVTSGPFAGLCTNYQVVAEAATRTVVRFEGVQPYQRGLPVAITNMHPVVESFTVLPPD